MVQSPHADPSTRPVFPTPVRHRNNSFVYMIPFTFSCAVLTLVPLLGELLTHWMHWRLRPELVDPAALRPLALLTGAAYAFVLLLRGFISDFQVLTLVALVVSLVTALMESLAAGSESLSAAYGLSATLGAMSTFMQGTFFAAAAVAGWLAPPPTAQRGRGSGIFSDHPPRFLVYVLSLLAISHFLLPLDMMLQSALHPGTSPADRATTHEAVRIGLWCFAAVWLVIGGYRALSHAEADETDAA